jgi:hypothetical protein
MIVFSFHDKVVGGGRKANAAICNDEAMAGDPSDEDKERAGRSG